MDLVAEKKFEITGTGIKALAAATMLIDHIGAGLLLYWLRQQTTYTGQIAQLETLYWTMRRIGRMAFPLYCYMLVEGYLHTKDLKKYVLRILAMGLISEVPFDLALKWKPVDWAHNNVMWELSLGLTVLLLMDTVLYKLEDVISDYQVRRMLRVAVMLLGMLIGHLTRFDYSAGGIACISVMYFLYGDTKEQRLMSYAAGVLMLALMCGEIEVFAFAMLIPIYFYEGHRGRDSKALRVFFYTFYPIHLIAIYLVRLLFL